MTQNTLAQTHEWFKKAVPVPENKNCTTQLGVHLEEVAEMLREISPLEAGTKNLLDSAVIVLEQLADSLKKTGAVTLHLKNRHDFTDALCDQIVTAVGVAHMHGVDIVGAMNEVNRSNFSKFVNGEPLFDENRKIKKGPHFTKPDLYPYV